MNALKMLLSVNHKSLIIGLNDKIRIFAWPILISNPDYYDISLDYSPITDMIFSPFG